MKSVSVSAGNSKSTNFKEGPGRTGKRATEPAEKVAVAAIESRGVFNGGSNRDLHHLVAGFIDIARIREVNVMHAAISIDPAGEAIIRATHQRHIVLNGPIDGAGCVLPLRGALTKPAVIREVEQEVGVVFGVFPNKMGKNIFKTDQHGSDHMERVQTKRDRLFAGRKFSLALDHLA